MITDYQLGRYDALSVQLKEINYDLKYRILPQYYMYELNRRKGIILHEIRKLIENVKLEEL